MSPETAHYHAIDAAAARFIPGDGGRSLFVWHHAPAPDVRRGAAVVLCPPLGYEYMSAYHSWKLLADSLAGSGFDALRLDYDGTGNSAGDYTDAGRVEAWLRSIARAIAAARDLSGSNRVALVGLRAGALLALHAAARVAVDRLVLWSPFATGSAYTRELKALASLSRQDYAEVDDREDELNAAGHLVTTATLDALARLTLDAVVARPADAALVVHRDDRTADAAVALTLTRLGCRVTEIRPAGTAAMLVPPQQAKSPAAAIDAIAGWLAGWSTAAANRRPVSSPPRDVAGVDSTLERSVRFGPNRRLFGMIGEPPVPTNRPAIVLFNTGVEHHIGPHRMYVPLARRWIAAGHVVLRFDIGGIGDSAPPPGMDENVAYPPHMLDDARDAVEFVRRSAPGRPLVAIGLCSGGWLAFRAAAAGLDVDAVVAINPPLYLREADRGAKWLAEQRELERYRQSMRVPGKWAKALRGRASYAAFTRVAGAVLSRSVANRVGGAFTDALPDGLARDLVTIADRRVRTLLVFSARGEALGYFEAHAQPAFRRGSVREIIRSVVVDGAGHSFRPRAAQQRLCELLTSFVAAEEPAPSPQPQPPS